MQIRYKKIVIGLNVVILSTIFFNTDLWINLQNISTHNKALFASSISQIFGSLIFYVASFSFLIFSLNSKIRVNPKIWKFNFTLNFICLLFLPLLSLLALFSNVPSEFITTVGVTILVVEFTPLINLISLLRFYKDKKEVQDAIGINGFTVLMSYAINNNIEEIKNLANSKFDINATDNKGYTALMYAASAGYIESVELLLELGADKSITTKNGNTALTFADKNKNWDVERLLKS